MTNSYPGKDFLGGNLPNFVIFYRIFCLLQDSDNVIRFIILNPTYFILFLL